MENICCLSAFGFVSLCPVSKSALAVFSILSVIFKCKTCIFAHKLPSELSSWWIRLSAIHFHAFFSVTFDIISRHKPTEMINHALIIVLAHISLLLKLLTTCFKWPCFLFMAIQSGCAVVISGTIFILFKSLANNGWISLTVTHSLFIKFFIVIAHNTVLALG